MRGQLRNAPLVGTFVNIPHPASVEILSRAGFKAVCLDSEHSIYDLKDISEGIRAAEGAGSVPLVRVPGPGPVISQVLDAGAAGVIIPRVSSAQEARSAVSFALYPPLGGRGVGLGRTSRYGAEAAQAAANPDDRSYVIVQIETAAGLADLDAICAVEGLDMIMVGPHDLAASMAEEMWSETHTATVREILARAQEHGLATALFVTSPEQMAEFSGLNVGLFLLSADVLMLAQGAAVLAQAAASNLPNYRTTTGGK
jgi:4-hydroxy-2-oxoheptanedioate aldolase